MNYEEKYKEALENLRKIKESNKDNNELVEFIECKFPELKESKAEWVEKIRKELKGYLGKRPLKKLSESDAVNQWIDWIEKQGKVNDYSLTMEDERIREELFEHCINRVDGKQVCVDANDYRRWADWLFRIGKENIPNVKSDEVIKNEIIKFLELPHPQFVGKRHQEDLIEKQCEQKPALSEDYERIRKEIISIVKSYRENCITEGNHRFDDCLACLENQGKVNDYSLTMEDEKIRKEILNVFKQLDKDSTICGRNYDYAKWIDWIEKQSKLEDMGNQDKQHLYDTIAALWDLLDKIDTFSDLQIDDTRPHNPFRKIEDITQERHKFVKSDGYNLFIEGEKITDFKQQSEQNTNKIEPKFKVGDWITNNCAIWCIENIHDGLYDIKGPNGGGMKNVKSKTIDDNFHLWTIQDAKEGGVICYKDEISLYKHDIKNCTKQETTFGGFVYYCCYDGKRFVIDSLYSLTEQDKMDIHPSTKEQRELLFAKMKEAGYEWDADKKELKKIKHKPVQETEPTPIFRVGDTLKRKGKDYTFIIDRIQGGYYHCDRSNGAFFPIEEQDNWELVEQKPAWSEEDEKNFSSLCELFTTFGSKHYTSYLRKEEMEKWLFHRFRNFPPKQEEWNDEDKDRLDSIKDNLRHVTYKSDVVKHKDFEWLGNLPYRVNLLSNHYWSEDDKEQLDRALYMMEQFNMTKSWDDVYNWLKSLKDRI